MPRISCRRVSDARTEPTLDMRARRLRIRVDQICGGAARRFDQLGVALEIGEAQQRQPALALSEVLPGSAQLEVAARDLEAVGRLVDDFEARARGRRKLAAIQQDAGALPRPAPDAAAQLVQLGEPEALRALDDHQRSV